MKFVATVVPDGIEDIWPFDLIHYVACISLAINFVCCVAAFYLFILAKRAKLYNWKTFFHLATGERILFYTLVCNLFYGVFHIVPHAWMLDVRDHPPDKICSIFAFLLTEFVLANSLITVYAAANALFMVTRGKKLPIGKYDWFLLTSSFGLPLGFGIPVFATDHYGPSGPWCSMDHRTRLGPFLANALGTVMILTFASMIICYGIVWIRLRQSAVAVHGSGENKYRRTARTMLLFVAAYLLQHWAFAVYSCWMLVQHPGLTITVFVVFFSNQGGICNLFIYIQMQRQKRKTAIELAIRRRQIRAKIAAMNVL